MEKTLVNYKSDFKVWLFDAAGFTVPFRFKFWTASPKRAVCACFDGENYHGCSLEDDGRLTVAFNNHGMGAGMLMVEMTYYLTDKDYRDGVCDYVVPPFKVTNVDADGTETEVWLSLQGDSDLGVQCMLPPFYQQGPRGERGERGERGPQGEQGPRGEQGKDADIDGANAAIANANAAAGAANNAAAGAATAAAAANSAAVRAEGAADEVEDNITLNTEKVKTAVQASEEAKSAADDAVFRAQGAVGTANSAALVAQQAKNIAEGRATGYVFNTKADLDAWLAVAANVEKLVVGDNLYIRAVDEPDYWWDGSSIQKLETEHPDLTGYVKNTDFATASIAGVVKVGNGSFGITKNSDGVLFISRAVKSDIIAKTDTYKPIACEQIDMAVKVGLTTNAIALTDIEKANAKKWLGFSPMTMEEYEALVDKSGINFVIPEDYDNQ